MTKFTPKWTSIGVAFILLFCSSIYAFSEKTIGKNHELKECLEICWGIDPHTAAYLENKFKPLLESHPSVIDDFILASKKLNIDFAVDKEIRPLPPEDGTFQAPEEHIVVFENPYIRVLLGSTKPGKREALHLHEWKSIMVIIKTTTYEMEYLDGSKEIGIWPIGAYELPGGEQYACTNIGETADEALRFEIKD